MGIKLLLELLLILSRKSLYSISAQGVELLRALEIGLKIKSLNLKGDSFSVDIMDDFLTNELGKNVVRAKDTPNFIANRIGVYGMMVTLEESRKSNLSIEDVDLDSYTISGTL